MNRKTLLAVIAATTGHWPDTLTPEPKNEPPPKEITALDLERIRKAEEKRRRKSGKK